jgi:nucleotide-binding universal stress UspA family protein
MKILLAVDGSIFSDEALKEVARRPWPAGSELKILAVVAPIPDVTPEPWVGMEDYYRAREKVERDHAQATLDRAVSTLGTSGNKALKVTAEAPFGSPKRVILEEAERWGADLIVVGSHGYGFWNRLLLGSVSQAIATHANCSVEIVRAPGSAEVASVQSQD